MFAKSVSIWNFIVGGATALAVGGLGWLDLATTGTPDAADASIREFGTVLTVLFGSVAGLWWNQSARLPGTLADEVTPAFQPQGAANILNGSAATFTVVSLFCSVFAGSPWRSIGSYLSAVGVLITLTFAGSDIRQAVAISLRLRPTLREICVAALIASGAAALLLHLGP